MHLEFILLASQGEQDTIITADKYLYNQIMEIMGRSRIATVKK